MVARGVQAQLAGLAQLTRFTNSLYAGTYTLVGATLAGGGAALLAPAPWLAALVVGLVVAYGFVINDYLDVVVDGLGKPWRPIPAGQISRRDALRLACSLAALALAAALGLGWELALFAAGTVAVAAAYSLVLKNTVLWGNACMGLLIAAIPLYGGLATGSAPPVLWMVAGLMWLFDFSHEVLKTTADHGGDRAAGLTTVATALGVRGAVGVFQLLALLFCGVALLPWLLGIAPALYGVALLVCALLPTIGVVALLARRHDDAAIALALRVMRYMWVSNLLPILVLGLK